MLDATNLGSNNSIAPFRTPCWIRVLVHGLFVGAFKQDNNGKPMLEIGALKKPSDGHERSLEVWKRDIAKRPDPEPVTDDTIVHLQINDSNGIYKYQQVGEFTGIDTDDRYDFRWFADFETEFYKEKCGKQEIGLRFTLDEGVAFTLLRSLPLLRKQDNGPSTKWRRIGQVLAIDIEYKAGRTAVLKVGDKDTELLKENRYNIVLRNDCHGANCVSSYDKSESDFTELLRRVVRKPTSCSPDFTVHKEPCFLPTSGYPSIGQLVMDKEVRTISGIVDPPRKQLNGLWTIFGPKSPFDGGDSKIDPCGMGFFGQSNGLDDQP